MKRLLVLILICLCSLNSICYAAYFEKSITYNGKTYTDPDIISAYNEYMTQSSSGSTSAIVRAKKELDKLISSKNNNTQNSKYDEPAGPPIPSTSSSKASTTSKYITITSGVWKGSEGNYWFDQGNGKYPSGNKWYYITTDGGAGSSWANYYYWFDNEGYWRPQYYSKNDPAQGYQEWGKTNTNTNTNNNNTNNQKIISNNTNNTNNSGNYGISISGGKLDANFFVDNTTQTFEKETKTVGDPNAYTNTSISNSYSYITPPSSNIISNSNNINNNTNTNTNTDNTSNTVKVSNSDNSLDEYLENGVFTGDVYTTVSKSASWKKVSGTDTGIWPGYGISVKFAGQDNKGFFLGDYFILSTTDDVLYDTNNKKISGVYGVEEALEEGVYLIGSGKKYYLYEFNNYTGIKLHSTACFNANGEIESGYTPNIDPEELGIPVYNKDEIIKKSGIYYTEYDSDDKNNSKAIIDGYWLYNSGNSYSLYYSNSNGTSSSKQSGTIYKIKLYIDKKLGGSIDSATEGKIGSRNSSSLNNNNSSTKTDSNTNTTPTTTVKTETVQKVKLLFSSNGGTGTMNSIENNKGSSIVIPSNKFTKTNYTFKMWETNDKKLYKPGDELITDDDIVLTAVWDKNINKMTNSEKQDELDELEREKEELMKLLEGYLN